MKKIILASQSLIRKRALDILGIDYTCIPAHIDEKAIRNTDPLKMAIEISEAKAYAVGSKKASQFMKIFITGVLKSFRINISYCLCS